MSEIINSVGIDIGTSTTQLVFSRLTVENRASGYTVPRISIVDKEIVYRSDIYFTPLLSAFEIDVDELMKIIREEYRKAGMTPESVQTGAVIITGDTARKQNANQVLNSLSEIAGDFVVATAGPDLESVLAARGAGTDKISEEQRLVIANLDVGGGTSNIAVYDKGQLVGVTCLDIGGRLVKVENGKITYIFHKIKKLAEENGILISEGSSVDAGTLRKLCVIMSGILAQSIGLAPITDACRYSYTNNGKGLKDVPPIAGVTFSGGVADYVYSGDGEDLFRYGDIGILLGEAIFQDKHFSGVKRYKPAETIRATVVGAGVHTTEISGSTISFASGILPIKNIPILRVSEEDELSKSAMSLAIRVQIPLYMPDGQLEQIAIAFTGLNHNSFNEIQDLADAVIQGTEEVIKSRFPLIIVTEHDIGKALGHAINVKLAHKKDVICIDGIRTLSGDYIDIGEPVCGGYVLPVVIKTLIFNS